MHKDLFFESLDWLQPSLSKAEALRRDSNPADAQSAALAVIRNKFKAAAPDFPRLDLCGDLEAQAEGLLERRVTLLNEEIELDTPIQWSKLAESDGQRNWHLGYSYWLNALAWKYAQSQDERYAEQWCQYVEEFLDGCPYAADARGYWPTRPMVQNDLKICNLGENGSPHHKDAPENSRSQWMSLSCHFRIETWLAGLARLADSDALTDDRLIRILDSLVNDHGYVCVMNPRENTPNQFTAVTLSLLKLSLLLPEHRACASYFLIAWERLQRVFSNTMLPDGSDLEQSLDYNAFLLDLGNEALSLLNDAPQSRRDLISEAIRKRLRFLTAILAPGNLQPPIGKGHYENKQPALLAVAEALNDAISIDALTQQSGPLRQSITFPYGGYHCLRDESSYLLFKNSGRGVGHMHEDCLSFILWANGHELLTDPSHFTYNTDTEEEAALNAYALGTQGHNSVCIDGLGQRRLPLSKSGSRKDDEIPELRAGEQEPLPFRTGQNEHFAFLEGRYADAFGPGGEIEVTHTRTIIAVKNTGWLVIDQFSGATKGRRSQQHWHLSERFGGTDVEQVNDRELRTRVKNGSNFRIISLDPKAPQAKLERGQMNPPQGWTFPKYGMKTPAWELLWERELDAQPFYATWIECVEDFTTSTSIIEHKDSTILWKTEKGVALELLINDRTVEFIAAGKSLNWQIREGEISPPLPVADGKPLLILPTEQVLQ